MPPVSHFDDNCTIISILPFSITEHKPGLIPGTFTIPGVAKPNEEIATLVVGRAKFPVYIDENRPSLIVPEPADRVCAALVRDYSIGIAGYEAGVAEPGLMWVPGALTKDVILAQYGKELRQLRHNQTNWFRALVSLADDDWSKYRIRRMISQLQRLACNHLGLERDWNIDGEIEAINAASMIECKFCKQPVHQDAIVCGSCTGVLNLERFKKEFVSAKDLTQAQTK